MLMDKTPKKHNTKFVIIILVAFTAIIGFCIFVLFQMKPTTPTKITTTIPAFTFTGSPDWREGPSNEVSMALFSKARPDGTSACFTSAELKQGTVDIPTELQNQQRELEATDNTMVLLSTSSSTLHAKDSDKPYELHQYEISGSGNNMNGLTLGYVQLDHEYVELEAHCDTADQLPSVLPALQTYQLNR